MRTLEPLDEVGSATELARLHAVCFPQTERWSVGQVEGSLLQATTFGSAVVEGEELLGFILCQGTAEEVEILTFCVDPHVRKQGLGHALLRAVKKQAAGRKVFLEVAADNEPAKKLYEKAGFERMGTRKGYYKREEAQVDALTYCFKSE